MKNYIALLEEDCLKDVAGGKLHDGGPPPDSNVMNRGGQVMPAQAGAQLEYLGLVGTGLPFSSIQN